MPHPILTEHPSFNKIIAIELNFTAERLMALPEAKIQEVFDGLHTDIEGDKFTSAMRFVMSLIMDSDHHLTEYVNRVFGNFCDAYFFDSPREKVPLFAWFFFNHLVKKDGEGFRVKQINLDTLEAV